MTATPQATDVVAFWFSECSPQDWFKKSDAFDARLKERFGALVQQALDGGLSDWESSFEGCMALILVLDQFTRNIFRDTPKAFSGDPRAIKLSQLCVERGYMDGQSAAHRQFMLMPMMHSEVLAVHQSARPLFKEHTDARTLDYADQHRVIIERFGRYPHRNAILGRTSTAEEKVYLSKPGAGF